MKSTAPSNRVRLEKVVSETQPVAMLRQEPAELSERLPLDFQAGYDDLDRLVFAVLPVGDRQVVLVRHNNAPEPGTLICVAPDEAEVETILLESAQTLKLSYPDSFTWVHPNFERLVRQGVSVRK